MGPSLVRGSSVVRGFDGQNISSQKPRTREVLLYYSLCNKRHELAQNFLSLILINLVPKVASYCE